jgi:Na+/melibiose symporter-like transporter
VLVMSPLAARLVERIGTTRVVAGGMAAVAASMLLVLLLDDTSPPWLPALVALVVSLGFGTVMAPATESIMGALPRAKAGVGSAVNDTTRQLGAAIGVALFGSLLASRYRATVDDRLAGLVPPDVLGEVGRNVQHGITTGNAAPGDTRVQIIAAAKDAFLDGFHLAVVVGAAICLLGAIAVLRFLPARATTSPESPDRPAHRAG